MSDDPFEFFDGIDEDADSVEPAGRAGDTETTAGGDVEEVPPVYDNFYQFMNEFIAPQLSRKLSEQSGAGLRWDPDWWRYPEAVLRAELMWRSFEAARIKDIKDPGELEAWMRLVVDHHMPILLNGHTGPMASSAGPMKPLGGTYPSNYGVISTDEPDDHAQAPGPGVPEQHHGSDTAEQDTHP